jgi:predicted HicB family RNase H-like nuclease
MTADDTQQLPVRLPRPLYEQLRRTAFEAGIPMNQIVIAALRKELGNAHVSGH